MKNQESARLWKKINCQTSNKINSVKVIAKENRKGKNRGITYGQQNPGTRPSSNSEQISFSQLQISEICAQKRQYKRQCFDNRSQDLKCLLEELYDPQNVIECQSEVSFGDQQGKETNNNGKKYQDVFKIFKNIINSFGQQILQLKSYVKLQQSKMSNYNKEFTDSFLQAFEKRRVQFQDLKKTNKQLEERNLQLMNSQIQKNRQIVSLKKLTTNLESIIYQNQKENNELKQKIEEIEKKYCTKNEQLEKNIKNLLKECEKKQKNYSYKTLLSTQSQINESIKAPSYRVQYLRQSIQEFKNSMAQKAKLRIKDQNSEQYNLYCMKDYSPSKEFITQRKKASPNKIKNFYSSNTQLSDIPTRNSFTNFNHISSKMKYRQEREKFSRNPHLRTENKSSEKLYFHNIDGQIKKIKDPKEQEIINLGTRLKKMKMDIQQEIKMMKKVEPI